jgi:hypothetical protein
MCKSRYLVVTACAVLTVAALGGSASRADLILYTAALSGAAEADPNASPGTGLAQIDYDGTAHTLRVRATFSGLLGNTTASHIHAATADPLAGTAGVATTTPTFANFPLGVKFGSYDNTLDMTLASSYNPSFITAHGGTTAGAEAFLVSSFAAGKSYFNIHSSLYAFGEIRGFLQPVPEPSTFVLAGVAAVGLLAWGWRRRKPVE